MKSGTAILEVINSNIEYKGLYNPAITECKKGFRTENGLQKAVKNLIDYANKTQWIKAYKLKVFNGNYEYYKNNTLIYESELFEK